jgi:hypothetical protein
VAKPITPIDPNVIFHPKIPKNDSFFAKIGHFMAKNGPNMGFFGNFGQILVKLELNCMNLMIFGPKLAFFGQKVANLAQKWPFLAKMAIFAGLVCDITHFCVTHKILCETCVKKLKIKSDFTHELKTTSD